MRFFCMFQRFSAPQLYKIALLTNRKGTVTESENASGATYPRHNYFLKGGNVSFVTGMRQSRADGKIYLADRETGNT